MYRDGFSRKFVVPAKDADDFIKSYNGSWKPTIDKNFHSQYRDAIADKELLTYALNNSQ